MAPKYLDPDALETPAVALNCAARETLRMGDEVRDMLVKTELVFRGNDELLKKEVEQSDDLVDRLDGTVPAPSGLYGGRGDD